MKGAAIISLIPKLWSSCVKFYNKYKEWDMKKKIMFLTITPISLYAIVMLVERYGHEEVVKGIHLLGMLLEQVVSVL